jgi:LuxR family transcriptional regulator, maltose regulon positive regulatory protein
VPDLPAIRRTIPVLRTNTVSRSRLMARLNWDVRGRVTLISAPAGSGKSTLAAQWLSGDPTPAAWLALDNVHNAPHIFVRDVAESLRGVVADIGGDTLSMLRAQPAPPAAAALTALINDLTDDGRVLTLALDDVHLIDQTETEALLAQLIEHQPPWLHLLLITREDPQIPLARLRASGRLVELRAADLSFDRVEVGHFLAQTMGLHLPGDLVDTLAQRTEGWAAGLQLAALSLTGRDDPAAFVTSFAGTHQFVLDYLIEEVLGRQSAAMQEFLLRCAVADRLCGPLCDVLVPDLGMTGHDALRAAEAANLFVIALDDERGWYRFHQLFVDLLRQRLRQRFTADQIADLHRVACHWHRGNGLEVDALRHAASADDTGVAADIIEGGGMPLHFRGGVFAVLSWLRAQSPATLDARPSLWVIYASALLLTSRIDDVLPRLIAAESALSRLPPDETTRDWLGHAASIRATLAFAAVQPDEILAQSQRALALLSPNNLPVQAATRWTLGVAHQFRGEYVEAQRALAEALAVSEPIGHQIIVIMSSIGLGQIALAANRLDDAEHAYLRAAAWARDPALPVAAEACLGLARVALARGDLDTAEREARAGIDLLPLMTRTDRSVAAQILLARLRLARGDRSGAQTCLSTAQAEAVARGFAWLLPEIAGVQAEIDRAQPPGHSGTASYIDPLSPRELEVLQLMAKGLSNQEIADRLFVSLSTVKGHSQRLFDKLQARRRTGAIARARELGLIET